MLAVTLVLIALVLGLNLVASFVVLGRDEDLQKTTMTVGGLNLIKYAQVPEGLESVTKIRYKDAGALSTLQPQADGKLVVEFNTVVRAIAPGQSAVFYEGDDLIGGGIIHAPVELARV